MDTTALSSPKWSSRPGLTYSPGYTRALGSTGIHIPRPQVQPRQYKSVHPQVTNALPQYVPTMDYPRTAYTTVLWIASTRYGQMKTRVRNRTCDEHWI